jgi:hypothetical protein
MLLISSCGEKYLPCEMRDTTDKATRSVKLCDFVTENGHKKLPWSHTLHTDLLYVANVNVK